MADPEVSTRLPPNPPSLLAFHNSESAYGVYPAAETYPVPATGNLSIHGQLMPFVEQGNLFAQ